MVVADDVPGTSEHRLKTTVMHYTLKAPRGTLFLGNNRSGGGALCIMLQGVLFIFPTTTVVYVNNGLGARGFAVKPITVKRFFSRESRFVTKAT